MLVPFHNYRPTPKFDNLPWTEIKIYEAALEDGPWTLIDTQALVPLDSNPQDPLFRSFSTENATLEEGWYRVDFLDANGNTIETDPIWHSPKVEIMASLEDVNAHLNEAATFADSNDIHLPEISVARIIRGYLARVVDRVTLHTWSKPETTPEIIREIAGMLIAAQVYMNKMSAQSGEIPDTHYAQKLYDRAMEILNGIIAGSIIVEDVVITSDTGLTELDFFPVDETDRAFTMGMEL